MNGGVLGQSCEKSPKANRGLEIQVAIRDRAPFWAAQVTDTEVDRMELNFSPAQEDEFRERSSAIGSQTQPIRPA